MIDYNKTYYDLIDEIRNILNRHNLSAINFLKTTSPEHKEAHDEILLTLTKYIHNEQDRHETSHINSKAMESYILSLDKDNANTNSTHDFKLANLLHTYLNAFYNKYFFIQNGKLILQTNKLKFTLPRAHSNNFEDFEENSRTIENSLGNINLNPIRELALLIMPDGTAYNAQNDHLTCARWLNVNGIDIDKAIRFETSKQYYDFNFGSLYNYDFSEKSDQNEFLEITDEQATIIGDLYKALCFNWKYLKPMEKCLINCKGFGFTHKDYVPELCVKNISQIENETKGFFDTYDYMKYLKEKIHAYSSKTLLE